MKLIDIPYFGKKYFLPRLIQKEGGQQESSTLREIYKKEYKVFVDNYSYGCFEPDFNYSTGGQIIIGKYCSFAKGVRYFGANHPIDYVSMSPYFYNRRFGFNVIDVERKTLVVGNGVWCGYGALITNGCNLIGNGAVVAAGSVVTRDVPPYAIVAGNPARVIRYRFADDVIKSIEESEWWELAPNELIKCYEKIDSPKEFCELVNERRKLESRPS